MNTDTMTTISFLNFRRFIPIALALFALATAGCARVAVLSVVRADGSMSRTLVYHGTPVAAKGSMAALTPEGGNLEDIVAPPTKASGWQVTHVMTAGKDGGEVTITASRILAAGSPGGNDLGLKGEVPAITSGPTKQVNSTMLVSNVVTVMKTAEGGLEYRETLHWLGKKNEAFGTEPTPELLTALKTELPPALASDTVSLRKAALDLQRRVWQAMMGPGDPILPMLMFHPDYAQYRLTQQLQVAATQTLSDVYGNRLTDADRKRMIVAIVANAAKQATIKTESQKSARNPLAGDAKSNSSMPIPLLFRVQMPGKVTATNGQIDPLTGEVVWPLYSSSPAGGDVVLTATCAAK